MSKIGDIVKEIEELEEKILELKSKYMRLIIPCGNKDCKFYDNTHSLNCRWHWRVNNCIVHTCDDYFEEGKQ